MRYAEVSVNSPVAQRRAFSYAIPPDLRVLPRAQTSKIAIDATTKFKGHEFMTVVRDSKEIRKRIDGRWKEYGFKI